MPYQWKSRFDVDETVLVIKNSLERDGQVPEWLQKTVRSALSQSDREMSGYFFKELGRFAPEGERYFERSGD